jgi:hypothetical protein
MNEMNEMNLNLHLMKKEETREREREREWLCMVPVNRLGEAERLKFDCLLV